MSELDETITEVNALLSERILDVQDALSNHEWLKAKEILTQLSLEANHLAISCIMFYFGGEKQ